MTTDLRCLWCCGYLYIAPNYRFYNKEENLHSVLGNNRLNIKGTSKKKKK